MDMFVDPPSSGRLYNSILHSFIFSFISKIWCVVFRLLSFFAPWIVTSEKQRRIKQLNEKLKSVENYKEWTTIAEELDVLEDVNAWRIKPESRHYDSSLIAHRLNAMRKHHEKGDLESMILALRAGLLRNLGGMGNPRLFLRSRVGTKFLIEDYINEVVDQLNIISDVETKDFPFGDKYRFFFETQQAFGRTALLLSGGATLGLHHLGVVRSLWENSLLPKVISGSSVGSIVASVVGVTTDADFPLLFQSKTLRLEAFETLGQRGGFLRKLKRLFKKGVLFEISTLQGCVRDNVGDITFMEAYNKTGRILNITVCSTTPFELPKLLNYLTAPNVLIWSAACASCALKGLYEPVELMAKDKMGNIIPYHPSGLKWSDGSVENDLPMERLSELFNVNHFIVSQVNPHVIPFLSLSDEQDYGLSATVKYLLKSEIQHIITQLAYLGLLPAFLSGLPAIITQKYEGDVTIVPQVTLKDYSKLISNPDPELIMQCMRKGMKSTWPKLNIIRSRCQIEFTLEKILYKLRSQEKINKSQNNLHV